MYRVSNPYGKSLIPQMKLERLVKDNTKTIQDTQEKPWEEGKLDAFDQIIQ